MKNIRVAILGATGLVGQKILEVLVDRATPITDLVPLATDGQGRQITFGGRTIPVEPVEGMDWNRVDIAFFAASNDASARYAPLATKAGVTVVDKSSFFRMDPEVPLVVPEVNPSSIGDSLLIASPNCSTIQMVVALNPIRLRYGLRKVLVSTYQAVSGTGREAMATLRRESEQYLAGSQPEPSTYPSLIGFNVLPFCDRFGEMDYTGEEWKLTRETQKIFSQAIPVSATAVRVPVFVGHAEAVYVETEQPFEVSDIRALLSNAPSVKVVDDPAQGVVPTPLASADQDLVLVGRIRQDPFEPRGLHLFVVADNLRKGAATNAVQIIESLNSRF
ncbi:MAG: aspartate-semialdehyde dehydrogenase [Sulfobacillus sp.]